jgi:hypothetical protein
MPVSIKIKITILIALFTYKSWPQTDINLAAFNGRCTNLTIQETLEYISNLTGIRFAYSSVSIDDNQRISLSFENATLENLLNKLCTIAGLKYSKIGNQVLLKKEIPGSTKFILTGNIVEQDSITPISYATVSLTGKQKGTVSDINGLFEIEISNENLSDTLLFSFMGYESLKIPVADYQLFNDNLIVLKETVFEIAPAKISSRDFKKINMGNNRNIPSGSLYMDTNGQQVALFVENEKKVNGKILCLNYYLSSSGNTDAPFRVRLYSVDTVSGSLGDDLIDDMIVVKPDIKKGWYSVDVRKLDIMVPENGFYIAMEGVFPNDYDFYAGDGDFVDLTTGDKEMETDVPVSIIYGQRLGYSRRRKDKDNTWHYSLSHTWFQLKKQPFGIMVSADIQIRRKKRH